jgi:hypothetical protein
MKIRSNVKAGGYNSNHNQTITRGVKVRSSVKAGGVMNHNQTTVRGLKVRTKSSLSNG